MGIDITVDGNQEINSLFVADDDLWFL